MKNRGADFQPARDSENLGDRQVTNLPHVPSQQADRGPAFVAKNASSGPPRGLLSVDQGGGALSVAMFSAAEAGTEKSLVEALFGSDSFKLYS